MATKGSNVTGDQERYDISTDGETWTATVRNSGGDIF
jgi:hypothetical protein